jgi:hypothetical protein
VSCLAVTLLDGYASGTADHPAGTPTTPNALGADPPCSAAELPDGAPRALRLVAGG